MMDKRAVEEKERRMHSRYAKGEEGDGEGVGGGGRARERARARARAKWEWAGAARGEGCIQRGEGSGEDKHLGKRKPTEE